MPADHRNLPRPGLALGRYPERAATPKNRLDAMLHRLSSSLESRWVSRPAGTAHILAGITTAGERLQKTSDSALQSELSALTTSLQIEGWHEQLAMHAFAIIRELSHRVLGKRHYNAQLLGGWAMLQGRLAEMQTGEGKTLTATLPAATAALARVPVHIITANDYLAARDAEQTYPLYQALGLSVGVINESMSFGDRRKAYACDITYCTNKQIAFDYLRDRVARGTAANRLRDELAHFNDPTAGKSKLMLRGLCFAIIDEADSVLIDEARTPLVLSRPSKFDDSMENICWTALRLADELAKDIDFSINARARTVELLPSGASLLIERAGQLDPLWQSRRQREAWVQQALSAIHLFIRDQDYIVRNNAIQIIDRNTGRPLPDRSWEHGLHQMIEARERCELTPPKETLARISYQRFFKRYRHLSGMTGTAHEVKNELAEVYGLSVVSIAPHRASRRVAGTEKIYANTDQAMTAAVNSTRERIESGRPVLIGTRSVRKSEQIALRLMRSGASVQVLNARQNDHEAQVIAGAGKAGQITVATNMAGRGTDITLDPDVKDNGGLHVIVLEHNDASRLDRQLYGRCGRQGDPGSYQIISSLEDDLPLPHWARATLAALARYPGGKANRIPPRIGRWLMQLAQRQLERQHRQSRRQVEYEDSQTRESLSFSGAPE